MTNNSDNGIKILEESIVIFDKVNNKIDGLIECSVKDFEILNSNFKDLFFNIQEMAAFTEKVIQHINFLNANEKLKKLTNNKNYSKEKILTNLNNNIVQLKKVDKSLNYFVLLLSNSKQDLSTLKLLITNLRFNPVILTDYNKINNLLDGLFNWHLNQEITIKNLRVNLKNTIKFAEEGLYSSVEISSELIEKCIDTILYYLKLSKNSKKHSDYLKKLETAKTASTSEIITNLQFQDILRQQIEHVQAAHKEITTNLKNSHREGELLSVDDLYKIRDINILQSAQLIHANREYQSAVEVILNKINELTSLHNQYNNFWTQFCKPESIKLSSLQTTIAEQYTILNSQMFSLNHLSDRFNQMITDAQQEYQSFFYIKLKNPDVRNSLSEIKSLISKIEQPHVKNKNVNPINQISNEVRKIEDTLEKIEQEHQKIYIDKKTETPVFLLEKDSSTDIITSFTNYLEEFSDELQSNTETLTLKLQLQKRSSFSVDQVFYYKTFEKEVQEIINLLDNLLSDINLNRMEIDNEELEQVKKLYTMESERSVHNKVTGKKGSDDKAKDADEDDIKNNDVEFF